MRLKIIHIYIYIYICVCVCVCVCVCNNDLALNNPKGLICHKTKPNQISHSLFDRVLEKMDDKQGLIYKERCIHDCIKQAVHKAEKSIRCEVVFG